MNIIDRIDDFLNEEEAQGQFKIRKKTTFSEGNRKKADVFANGIKIGEWEKDVDWIKSKNSRRIRDKKSNVYAFYWDSNGLSEIFGKKVTAGSFRSWGKSPDFTNYNRDRYNITNQMILDALERFDPGE